MKSFMDWDLKQRGALASEAVQIILQARREAHFYDVSFPVILEAEKIIAQNNKGLKTFSNKEPIPPTRAGYMRLNTPDIGIEYLTPDKRMMSMTVNGMLWNDKKWWFFHDPGNLENIEIVPFEITTHSNPEELRNGDGHLMTDVPDGVHVPPWRCRRIEKISHYASEGLYKVIQNTLEEVFEVAAVLFDMIAETKATTVQHEQCAHAFPAKHKPFYTKTTIVKIALSKCRNKYLRGKAEPTGRVMPWHEPRAHFAHWRVTDPNCAHNWQPRGTDDDGKRYKCAACGEIKTRREFPNGRGSKDIGIIKTNYEIVQ